MLSARVDTTPALRNNIAEHNQSPRKGFAALGKRPFLRFLLCLSLMFGVVVSISFFASTSAQRRDAALIKKQRMALPSLKPDSILAVESVNTFAADCATPQNAFVLGNTVCAKVNGAPLPFFGFRQRRFQWVTPSGSVVQLTDITTDPQDDTYVIPTTGPFAEVGTWTVRTIKNNGSTVTIARFVVRDPANLRVDLSIGKFGKFEVKSGTNTSYFISVANRGPDDAQNVSLTDDVPSNMSFVAVTQLTGPAFTCATPPVGGVGTITCTLGTLPAGATATFNFTFEVAEGTPIGTTILNSVNISNSIAELNPADNTSSAAVTVTGAGGGGGDCILSCPADVSVVAPNNASGAIVTYAPPTTSGTACGSVSCSPASGTFFPIGTTLVTCQGEVGEACNFSVTVEDVQNPTINCPSNVTGNEDTPGSGFGMITFPSPTAADNSGFVTVSCDHESPSSFPVGTTTVTCTARDQSNNTASCSFTVTVNGTGCALTCPADIVVTAPTGSCSAVVTFSPTASSGCGMVTSVPASGSVFPIGTTPVTVTATSGRSCTFNVTVLDDQDPTITSCPASITVDATSGSCSAIVNPGIATATDSCSSVVVTGTRSDDQPITDHNYPVGSTTITWTATDSSGNTASCQQIITVRDFVSPTIVSVSVPPDVAIVDADADCHALIPDVTPYVTATDNCTPSAGLIISQSPAANTLVNAGVYVITITVRDSDPGNTATATTTFTVRDVIPPVLTVNGANPLTVECHTSLVDPGATAHDTCAGDFAATASGVVDVNTPGSYTITYNASDPSGNPAVAVTRTVNVVDTIAPVITLNGTNPMTVECHTSFTDPGATAVDSCAGNRPVTVTGSVNINVPGTYTLTYSASDNSGHTTTVTRTVYVVDTTPPTITLTGQSISLWPPNHKYVTINLTQLVASASDGCDGTVTINNVVISKVTSDELENSGGDGNTLNDMVIAANCKSVQLRAERDGGGDGRVYTITFRVRDAAGNTTTKTAKVTVPQSNNGNPAVDSGPRYTVNGTCP